jgi:hypothetical protein
MAGLDPGLVPVIHAVVEGRQGFARVITIRLNRRLDLHSRRSPNHVDDRDKPGHDEGGGSPLFFLSPFPLRKIEAVIL